MPMSKLNKKVSYHYILFSLFTISFIYAPNVCTRTLLFPLVASDPFYSDSNMAHLRRGIEALNSDKGTEHELIDEHAPIS